MMVLEACNTSAAIGVKTAKSKFYELSLSNFPGENIAQFAVLALKYIKIMKGGFSLPTDLGSTLLIKASKTGTELFNRQVMDQYTMSDSLERRYEMKDPKLLLADPDYDKYGPVGCCSFLQEKYAIIFTQKRWTALLESFSANEAPSIAR